VYAKLVHILFALHGCYILVDDRHVVLAVVGCVTSWELSSMEPISTILNAESEVLPTISVKLFDPLVPIIEIHMTAVEDVVNKSEIPQIEFVVSDATQRLHAQNVSMDVLYTPNEKCDIVVAFNSEAHNVMLANCINPMGVLQAAIEKAGVRFPDMPARHEDHFRDVNVGNISVSVPTTLDHVVAAVPDADHVVLENRAKGIPALGSYF
jgi:hypothetical protein